MIIQIKHKGSIGLTDSDAMFYFYDQLLSRVCYHFDDLHGLK